MSNENEQVNGGDSTEEQAPNVFAMTPEKIMEYMAGHGEPIMVMEFFNENGEESEVDTVVGAVIVLQGPATRALIDAMMAKGNELAAAVQTSANDEETPDVPREH